MYTAVSSVLSFALGTLITSLVVCGCHVYRSSTRAMPSQHAGERGTSMATKETVDISDNVAYGTSVKAGHQFANVAK